MRGKNRVWLIAVLVSLCVAAAGCASEKSASSDDSAMKDQSMNQDQGMDEDQGMNDQGMNDQGMNDQASAMHTKSVKGGPEGVELGGYCPVAYKMAGKPVEGTAKYSVERDGKTYLLASAKAMKAYQQKPEKFVVKYDGWCATALSMGKKVKSDPTIFEVYQGKTYLFASPKAKAMFDKNPDAIVQKANQHWKDE